MATATFPYLSIAELRGQGGEPVDGAGEVPCSIWPATSYSADAGGRHHTHRGEAAYAYRDALRVPNRHLVVDGQRYKIVSATPMSLVRHVVLELLESGGHS